MGFSIRFLLIGSLSIITVISAAVPVDRMKIDVHKFIESKGSSISGSSYQIVRLMEEIKLGETGHSVVWKGDYNDRYTHENIEVAVKITIDKSCYDREIRVYEALNATTDPTIEQYGIPRVYYHGSFLQKYRVIAMTLFEGTLEDLYNTSGDISSNLSILLIFKQAVKVLSFLHTVGDLYILHNDIKPGNIFLRGGTVFISDFDFATLNFDQTIGNSPIFASRNYYNQMDRYPMDDLESLVYSMWYVTGVPMVRTLENGAEPEGCALSRCRSKAAAKERMMEKCKYYNNDNVRKAIESVCDNVLSGVRFINYRKIIKELDDAISHVYGSESAQL